MKRLRWGTCILMFLLLSACAEVPAAESIEEIMAWQDYYDLGARYLSEGNYEEAIIAFTAAIEIDPNRPEAYVGRGDAYVEAGETSENLAAAQKDYEKAIELDSTIAEAYLGLADIYIRQNDYEKARSILQQASEKIPGNQALKEKAQEVELHLNDLFLSSNSYVEIQSLNDKQVQLLSDAMYLIQKPEASGVEQLLIENSHMFEEMVNGKLDEDGYGVGMLRTMMEGKKIEVVFTRLQSWNTNGELGFYLEITFEMRPESGTAYYFEAYDNNQSGLSKTAFSYGNCENWNWNGDFVHTYTFKYNERDEVQRCIGTLINGLVDGELFISNSDNRTSRIDEHYESFSNGLLIGIWENGRYNIGYRLDESGEREYCTSGEYDDFKDWYCTYQTGHRTKGKEGTFDLLW